MRKSKLADGDELSVLPGISGGSNKKVLKGVLLKGEQLENAKHQFLVNRVQVQHVEEAALNTLVATLQKFNLIFKEPDSDDYSRPP